LYQIAMVVSFDKERKWRDMMSNNVLVGCTKKRQRNFIIFKNYRSSNGIRLFFIRVAEAFSMAG